MRKPSAMVLFVSAVFVLAWMETSSSGKLFRKHNLKYEKRVYHMGDVQQNLIKKRSTPDFLTMTDHGPPGMTNVKRPSGTLTPAVGDGTNDDTSAIQAIINNVIGTSNNKIFFPPGEYLVSSDIVIRSFVELHGSEIGITVIKASTPYSNKIYNASPVRSVALKNLYFDGILVEFDGRHGGRTTQNINVFQCVFFSTASASAGDPNKKQLNLKRLKNGDVDKCVFLRDSTAFGVASGFFRTKQVDVHDNVCGLDLSKINWLSSELEPVSHWGDQKLKLGFLKSHYGLAADQGYFKSCLYDAYDRQMHIRENVFNGSPNTNPSRHRKDHVIYLKGFHGMFVTGNYARGWPADPSGGIKARNGQQLEIARNYIDDTGILLYTHDPKGAPLHHGLKNVIIYGNHIVQRSNPGNRASGISYYEPHYRRHNGVDENIKYSANVFEIVGVSDPTSYKCIWLTNGDLSHHHVYQDNVYYNTVYLTKVKLQARHASPSFEPGRIDRSISDRYNFAPYQLNIPTY